MKGDSAVKIFKVCDDGILIQLLCYWILSIFLFLFKTHNVSESGFSLRLRTYPQLIETVPLFI
jgi:hypothetical protein